jgi:hypothetical protein
MVGPPFDATHVHAPAPVGSTPITSGGQFLAMLVRFLFGYATAFACALLLLRKPAWTFSPVDAVFWCALGLAVVLQRLVARTEAEVRQWRRAAVRHAAVGALVWLCCQSVHLIP